ncbi:MAG TPA: hypothetical protein VHE33_07770, partial [Acidobacteriaceae bacterium]|nr:hypothetical protein [Acidobacteriaceae bacterium]
DRGDWMSPAHRTWMAVALSWTLLSLPASSSAQPTANAASSESLPLRVSFYSGAAYPSMKPAASIEVFLNGTTGDLATREKFVAVIRSAEDHGWNCASPSSYAVTVSGSTKRIPVSAVMPVGHENCNDRPTPAPVLLLLREKVDTNTKYVVSLEGLPDAALTGLSPGANLVSAAQAFPASTSYSVSVLPQAAPGEALTNGTTRDVGQLSVSFGVPYVGHSPVFINTNDLFSTDAKDTMSSFAVTAGSQWGLLSAWYTPVQVSETLQGNQTASSLSAVSNLSLSGLVPWYWTRQGLNNSWIDAPLAPEFALAAQYTHRFAQEVTAATPRLSGDDFSVNPALAIEPFYVLPGLCSRYRKWIGAKAGDSTSRQFCVGSRIDLGLWYLPRDKTQAGSQRVEGYGDASIVIPLSNLNFEKFQLIQKDNLLNSELTIKYSDSVNAANNYARSRQWTFGISVIK